MATNLQEIIPAIFTGPNGERLTPEQIAQRQQIAQSLIGRATDTSPDAGGWASVLTKGILGYKSGADTRAADAAIKANAEQSQNDIAALLNGGVGFPSAVASGASPTSAVATGTPVNTGKTVDLSGDKQKFIDALLPAAIEHGQRIGVDPRIIVAQAAQETGWGKSAPGNNFFGIKSHGKSGGQNLTTHEVINGKRVKINDSFRTFASPQDSVAGYADFLSSNKRYRPMLEAKGLEAQLQALGASGYATDPNYANSVGAIARSINLPTPNTPQEAIAQVAQQGGATILPGQFAPSKDANSVPYNGPGASFGGPQLVYDDQGMRYVNDPLYGQNSQGTSNFNDRWNAGAVTTEVPAVAPSPAVASALMPQPQTGPSESLLAQNDMILGGALSPSGSSPVAQALSGYFPEAPVASQPSGNNQMANIARILGSPYTSNEAKQVALVVYQQQQAQAQAALEQQRMMAQRQATAGALGINPSLAGADEAGWKAAIDQATRNRNTVTVGNTVYDANTGQPIIQGASERFQTITGERARQLGLDPNRAYNVGPDGKISSIGDNGVTVNVGGGEKFDEKLAELDAKAIGDIDTAGRQATRNLNRINQLEELLNASPNGIDAAWRQRAGEWGIKTEGLDTLQAAQAAINSLVPEQRQPGSGPMSDADLELFKQSLPRTINQPGGNALIIATMKAIAKYDAEGSRIIQRLRARQLTREEAFEALNNRENPIDDFKMAMAGGNTSVDGWRDVGNGVKIRAKQ